MRSAICEQLMLVLLVTTSLAGCSQTEVSCGGNVKPENADSEVLKRVSNAKTDSAVFCSKKGMGCDFSVARTKDGWSVAVTRTFAVDGRCVSRIGDEKFFVYDERGALIQVIDGM